MFAVHIKQQRQAGIGMPLPIDIIFKNIFSHLFFGKLSRYIVYCYFIRALSNVKFERAPRLTLISPSHGTIVVPIGIPTIGPRRRYAVDHTNVAAFERPIAYTRHTFGNDYALYFKIIECILINFIICAVALIVFPVFAIFSALHRTVRKFYVKYILLPTACNRYRRKSVLRQNISPKEALHPLTVSPHSLVSPSHWHSWCTFHHCIDNHILSINQLIDM